MAGGNIRVKFGAETSDLERGAARAGRSVDQFAKHGQRASGVLGSSAKHLLAYAGGIASVGAAAYAAKDAVKFTENLAKSTAALSRTTGLDAKTASEWVELAKIRGVEGAKLNKGFITLAKQMRQVELGSKNAKRAFADLGVSQKTLASGDMNKVLMATADAFKAMPDGAKQAAIAQQLFGRQSQVLLPLLNQGSDALRKNLGLVDEYGVALDKHGVKKALEAVQAQRRWQLALDGLKVTFAQNVLPALTKGVSAAAEFIRQIRSGEGAGGRFADRMKDIWKSVKPVVLSVGELAGKIAKFVGEHPALLKVAATMAAITASVRALSYVGAITGATKLLGIMKGVAAASAVSGAAGAAGAAGAGATAARVGGLSVVGAGGAGAAGGAARAGGMTAAGAGTLAIAILTLAAAVKHLQGTGFEKQSSAWGKLGSVLETTKHSVMSMGFQLWDKLIPGISKLSGGLIPAAARLVTGLGRSFKDVEPHIRRTGHEWDALNGKLKQRQAFAQARRNASEMATGVVGSMKYIRGQVALNMDYIRSHLGTKSKLGKEAIAANFRAAAAAVKRSMDAGTISTKAGMDLMYGYLAKALEQYGVSPSEAQYAVRNPTATAPSRAGTPTPAGGARPRRRGGYVFQAGGLVPSVLSPGEVVVPPAGGAFVVPGRPTAADTVPMALPSGSGVLTWSGQAMMALGASLSDAIGAQAPHFAAGGVVPKPARSTGLGTVSRVVNANLDVGYGYAQKLLTAASAAGAGTGTWQGVTVANWIIQLLKYAASKGFHGTVTSGYRSHATNVAHGRFYTSQHEFTKYPGGAIDFGGPHDSHAAGVRAAFLAAIAGNPFGRHMYPLIGDDGHVSGTGGRRGGFRRAGRWLRRMAAGGWVRTGATLDAGSDPKQQYAGGMSFAELLQAGTNRGLHPNLTQLLGMRDASGGYGMSYPYGPKPGAAQAIYVRMPGRSRSYRIVKSDVGSGQPGNRHYTIDLHGAIASRLGWHPNQDVEVSATGSGSAPAGASRTITRRTYSPPFPGTGRSRPGDWRAGWESGLNDPWGYGRAQERSDYYNASRAGLFGSWATTTRHVRGAPGSGGGQAAARAALGEVGHREGSAGNAASFARKYQRALGHGVEAYCGDFVAWAAKQGGAHPVSGWSYVPNYKGGTMSGLAGWTTRAKNARVGDAVAMRGFRHVELVVGRQGNSLVTVGGNTTGAGQGREGVYRSVRGAFDGIAHVKYRTGGVAGKAPGGWSGLPAKRTTRQQAYSTLWQLLNVGIGRGDEGRVKRLYARELRLIDGLGYNDLRYFSADVKNIWRRPFGARNTASTVRARLTDVLGWIDNAIGRSVSRPVGVTESVRESIGAAEARLPAQMTLAGVDPDSLQGRVWKSALDAQSVQRLWRRRATLVTAQARALRAGKRAEAADIGKEITAVDDQVLGLAAEMKTLRETVDANTAAADDQTALLKAQVENQQKLVALVTAQGPALIAAVTAAVSGDIGGRVGLGFQSPSFPGGLARY